MKFLLDANFLMIPGKFKVDVFRELEKFGRPELFTLDIVVKELGKLSHGKGKSAFYAKLGLSFVQEKDIGILESQDRKADSELVRLSGEGFTVCTQDKILISKIRKKGFHIIFLRQGKYLEIK
ncbi:MAG: DNA-binding protein [Candidatus Aenigmarchaeota archaeon]|nr:DNA-binding protein [Candidatus Aenigmarchaeota archaeon]